MNAIFLNLSLFKNVSIFEELLVKTKKKSSANLVIIVSEICKNHQLQFFQSSKEYWNLNFKLQLVIPVISQPLYNIKISNALRTGLFYLFSFFFSVLGCIKEDETINQSFRSLLPLNQYAYSTTPHYPGKRRKTKLPHMSINNLCVPTPPQGKKPHEKDPIIAHKNPTNFLREEIKGL